MIHVHANFEKNENDELSVSQEIKNQLRSQLHYVIRISELLRKNDGVILPNGFDLDSKQLVVLETSDEHGNNVQRWQAVHNAQFTKACSGLIINIWYIDKEEQLLDNCSKALNNFRKVMLLQRTRGSKASLI